MICLWLQTASTVHFECLLINKLQDLEYGTLSNYDMPDSFSPTPIGLLRPVRQAAFRQASRLHAEKSAISTPNKEKLLEHTFNDTLNRLRGGNITDPWWRNLLNVLGQLYISPEFLQIDAVREWLSQEQVTDDLKALAAERVMGGSAENPEIRKRLAMSYSEHTGEDSHRADGLINDVTTIFVASYIASIPSNQRPLAGMFQQLYGAFNEQLEGQEKQNLTAVTDIVTERFPLVQQLHTDYAEKELSEILFLRSLDQVSSLQRIQDLFQRVKEGELSSVDNSTKRKVYHWTARLCATQAETLPLAKEIRNELASSDDPGKNLSIVDALIFEADDDIDAALRCLRDLDDQDSRSTLFGLLVRARGEAKAFKWFEEQNDADNPNYFSPVGWVNWTIAAAKCEKWMDAAEVLPALESKWDEAPILAVVEGLINAALLLPQEYRTRVLDGAPLYHGIAPIHRDDAGTCHARATECFRSAERRLQGKVNEAWMKTLEDWSLWLRLMNPDTASANKARDQLKDEMKEGAKAVVLVPFAYSFGISYDPDPVREYLQQRKEVGGLDAPAWQAEFCLNAEFMTLKDFLGYLDENKLDLTQVIPPELFAASRVEGVLEAENSFDQARKIINEYREIIGDHHSKRLLMMVDAHEGNDIRKNLEELYQNTKSIVDLRNLISFLKRKGDRSALKPLCLELFHQVPTIESAIDVVASLADPSFFDHEAIIQFLDENESLLVQSEQLRSTKISALYHAGRYADAKIVNDVSKQQKLTPENLHCDLRIAIASGEWERIGGILNDAWKLRDDHDAYALVSLAHIAGQHGQTRERALQFLQLAVEKAPADPKILAAAYWQHFQLGYDDEVDPEWLSKAAELSSGDGGPIWSVSLSDIANEWLPKRRDRLKEVERKWFHGEIPIHLAAHAFNVSFSRLLLHTPTRNAIEPDGRHRAILPIVASGRPVIEVDEEWTVGVDVTSVMVLHYLGILGDALDSFRHIKLSPDILEHLFREETEVRFHQPSRIRAARDFLNLYEKGQLEVLNMVCSSSRDLIKEVGIETAELLQSARNSGGVVVCILPIYKAGSLMQQRADTSTYNDKIISLSAFCEWLYDRGEIGSDTCERVRSLLQNTGCPEETTDSPDLPEPPIYFDGLALRYLIDANALQEVVSAIRVAHVHSNIFQEMSALSEEGESEQEMLSDIEKIRHVLRSMFQDERASFLPRSPKQAEKVGEWSAGLETTLSLLEGSTACQALCIDDRYMNSHPNFTEPDERSIPVLSVLDILRHLLSQDRMTLPEYYGARHRLREGGFAFISPESDEICHWLKKINRKDGEFIESLELRVLRQMSTKIDSLELTNWRDAFALASNTRAACTQAIPELWQDPDMSPEDIMGRSTWIWRNLMATAVPGYKVLDHEAHSKLIGDMVSLRIGSLLLPLPTRSEQLQQYYEQWIEQTLLEHLWPANLMGIKMALRLARDAIASLDIDQVAYGFLFLEQLPERVFRLMVKDAPEFAIECGYRTEEVFEIGPEVKLLNNTLFDVADEVLSTKVKKSVQDMSGKEISVNYEKENECLILEWTDENETKQQVPIPDLCLLSPNADTRLATLDHIIHRLGPTFSDGIKDLRESLLVETLDYTRLSRIFDANTNGIAAIQGATAEKISGGLPMAISDFAPQSMGYYKQLVGPVPVDQESKVYLRQTLAEYRKDLLDRNPGKALDICCLGAVHDDLSPGQWVTSIDDDVLWSALSSGNLQSSPFSLLGALDVALYRQHDKRFHGFAVQAIEKLLHKNFGFGDHVDVYRLLQILGDFVLNRINLLEDGATFPGYWKRLAAWMQSGYIVGETLQSSNFLPLDSLETWTHENMVSAGVYANFVDARTEPMLFVTLMLPGNLRSEVLGRLQELRLRHEKEGHEVPCTEQIDGMMAEPGANGLKVALGFPGPLEGDRYPTAAVPSNVKLEIKELTVAGGGIKLLQFLMMLSQFYSLDDGELQLAKDAVKEIFKEKSEEDLKAVLEGLELACFVAAANRSSSLSDSIADIVVRISSLVSEREEVNMIPRILLHAAVAYQEKQQWFVWLEEQFLDVVKNLPSYPNPALEVMLSHLEEIEIILPTEHWFHTRAKSTALSGYVKRLDLGNG